jgi:hypothetical protein
VATCIDRAETLATAISTERAGTVVSLRWFPRRDRRDSVEEAVAAMVSVDVVAEEPVVAMGSPPNAGISLTTGDVSH